jgi:KDO2-lipid IV(A) lauroyltransferase
MTLAARLVEPTGAVLLLAWGERLAHGAGYAIHLAPFDAGALADAPQAESAAAINRAMEGLIRQRPRQYLWGYDRYKTPRTPRIEIVDASVAGSKD